MIKDIIIHKETPCDPLQNTRRFPNGMSGIQNGMISCYNVLLKTLFQYCMSY